MIWKKYINVNKDTTWCSMDVLLKDLNNVNCSAPTSLCFKHNTWLKHLSECLMN